MGKPTTLETVLPFSLLPKRCPCQTLSFSVLISCLSPSVMLTFAEVRDLLEGEQVEPHLPSPRPFECRHHCHILICHNLRSIGEQWSVATVCWQHKLHIIHDKVKLNLILNMYYTVARRGEETDFCLQLSRSRLDLPVTACWAEYKVTPISRTPESCLQLSKGLLPSSVVF